MERACLSFYSSITAQQAQQATADSPAWMHAETASEPIPTPRVLHILAPLLAYYQQQTPLKQTPRVVANLRDWDFYFNQYDTGPYSEVNCMPTMTAMALKWQNPAFSVSVEQIRARYPGDGGWYLHQVTESLDHYGARYQVDPLPDANDPDATIDALCARLDQGCIIATMMHEGDPTLSGHCMIIYGYRTLGESLWFDVYDPGAGTVENAYGVLPGQMRRLEGHYAAWIIGRHTDSYIVLLP